MIIVEFNVHLKACSLKNEENPKCTYWKYPTIERIIQVTKAMNTKPTLCATMPLLATLLET